MTLTYRQTVDQFWRCFAEWLWLIDRPLTSFEGVLLSVCMCAVLNMMGSSGCYIKSKTAKMPSGLSTFTCAVNMNDQQWCPVINTQYQLCADMMPIGTTLPEPSNPNTLMMCITVYSTIIPSNKDRQYAKHYSCNIVQAKEKTEFVSKCLLGQNRSWILETQVCRYNYI